MVEQHGYHLWGRNDGETLCSFSRHHLFFITAMIDYFLTTRIYDHVTMEYVG